jgi:ketosteroid isomerase-like protein
MTATATANAAVAREVVDAFQRGDLPTVAARFAPDAVWDLPGRGVLAGEYKGPDAIVGFLARAFELSGGTLRLEVLDVLGSDRGAAHVQRVTADHDGRHLDCVEVLAHEIVDGLIVRTHHRPDAYAIDAFFS